MSQKAETLGECNAPLHRAVDVVALDIHILRKRAAHYLREENYRDPEPTDA